MPAAVFVCTCHVYDIYFILEALVLCFIGLCLSLKKCYTNLPAHRWQHGLCTSSFPPGPPPSYRRQAHPAGATACSHFE